jgi:hypothetical protein
MNALHFILLLNHVLIIVLAILYFLAGISVYVERNSVRANIIYDKRKTTVLQISNNFIQ